MLRLDLSTMAWSAEPTTGAPPPRRTGHAAAGAGGALYVVGGRDGTGKSPLAGDRVDSVERENSKAGARTGQFVGGG